MMGERESEQLGLMGWVELRWPSQEQNRPLKGVKNIFYCAELCYSKHDLITILRHLDVGGMMETKSYFPISHNIVCLNTNESPPVGRIAGPQVS